jgi:hypothetical protein
MLLLLKQVPLRAFADSQQCSVHDLQAAIRGAFTEWERNPLNANLQLRQLGDHAREETRAFVTILKDP